MSNFIIRNNLNYPDFIVDSTYQREYLDSPEQPFMPDDWIGTVTTADLAFKIAEPIFESFLGEKEASYQKPYSINLIDDEIWIIDGTIHQPEDGIIFGGTVYMEIRKSNGEILKIVFSK